MSKGIEAYGIVTLFCAFCLILIGITGYSIYYKPLSDSSNAVVEILEVHEGLTSEAETIINELDANLTKAEFTISKNDLSDDYYSYTVASTATLKIPVLNISIPLKSEKHTKRCLY